MIPLLDKFKSFKQFQEAAIAVPLIGAGAKILGNVHIGEGAKVGAGSVVLAAVAPHTTVTGVPSGNVSSHVSSNCGERYFS